MKRIVILLVVLLAGILTTQAYRTYLLARADVRISQGSLQFALDNSPALQTTSWVNPDTGLAGSTMPLRTYRLASGQYCREYLTTVENGGGRQQAFGTACRQPTGGWKITSERPVRRYAGLNGPVHSADGYASHCPRNFLEHGETGLSGRRLPQFKDPYLAHLHWFLYMNPASGYYHNWQFYHDRGFDQGDIRRFHRWIHPPVTPTQPARKKIPDLVKFVEYRPGD